MPLRLRRSLWWTPFQSVLLESTDLLIRKAPFQRLVREIAHPRQACHYHAEAQLARCIGGERA
jgi:histone H3/H4